MSNFVDRISSIEGIQRKEMIEKDILLHQILLDLSSQKFISENFLFKGGTCLIKNYLGYFRFSEDIDFTWKNQEQFVGKTGGEIYKILSPILDSTAQILVQIASTRGLDFKWEKGNREYVELVNGGKICTFKVWYEQATLKTRTFLKIQINFIDTMCHRSQQGNLKSLLTGKHQDLDPLFQEYSEYSSTISLQMYDINEILSEKIRALLTRRAIKARDFLDVFFIHKKLGIEPKDVESCVIAKIGFALENYEKYRDNFEEKRKLLEKGSIFNWGTEQGLLLEKIDENEFNQFIDNFTKYLQDLVKKF